MHVPSAQSASEAHAPPSAWLPVATPASGCEGVPASCPAGVPASWLPVGLAAHWPARHSSPPGQSAVVSQPATQQFWRQTSPRPQAEFEVQDVPQTAFPFPGRTLLAQLAAKIKVQIQDVTADSRI